ncbi:leucine-rich repeat domain-containing protein [Bacteroides caecigallinarum]|nr:leucine-rich repeat domain-containing protein [Bacteroides caecigallinarum]
MSQLKSIGNEAFYDCSTLIEIKLPDGLTSIGKEAFYSCSALTSIKLPDDGLTSIGEKAFYNCSTLTSIKLPEGLKIIEKETFYGCTSLTDITIPESIEFIYDSFTGTALNTVTCLAETPPEVYFIAFMYANVIYVPAGSVEDYKKALNWSLYADKITAIP